MTLIDIQMLEAAEVAAACTECGLINKLVHINTRFCHEIPHPTRNRGYGLWGFHTAINNFDPSSPIERSFSVLSKYTFKVVAGQMYSSLLKLAYDTSLRGPERLVFNKPGILKDTSCSA